MARKPKGIGRTDGLTSVDAYMQGSPGARISDGHRLLETGELPGSRSTAGDMSRADQRLQSFYLGTITAASMQTLTQEQRDYSAIKGALDGGYVVSAEGPAQYVPLRLFTDEQGVVGLNPAATLTKLEEIVMEAEASGTELPPSLREYLGSGEMLSTNDALRDALEAEAAHPGNSRLLQELAGQHQQAFAAGTAFIYQLPTRVPPSP